VLELVAEQISVTLGSADVLHNVSVTLPRGRITALVGPNGSGKSTVLRALTRQLPVDRGVVRLDGRAISDFSARDFARKVAYLPQTVLSPPGMTVGELVACGRYPHQGIWRVPNKADDAAVDAALQVTGMVAFRDRLLNALSGGERQRAHIAVALAQEAEILLLDEPTTYLDIRHQIEILDLIRTLNRRQGLTVGWILHDLNQALAYSDEIVLLSAGRVVASGTPHAVLTPETIERVFGTTMVVLAHPQSGLPICVPAHVPAE